jgi:HSP20 family protein
MEQKMVETSHAATWWPNLYEPLRHVGQKVADWIAPRSDASAMQDSYEINVELPGVKPENVEVTVHDDSLYVRGEKRSEREEKGRTYFFTEREYGSFQRTFKLPPDADSEKVDATFGNGVLCLKIAKRTSAARAGKTIKIRKA